MLYRFLTVALLLLSAKANANLIVNGNFDDVGAPGEYLGEVIYPGYNDNPSLDTMTSDPFFNWGWYSTLPGWQVIGGMAAGGQLVAQGDAVIEVLHSGAVGGLQAHSSNLFIEFDIDSSNLQFNSVIGQTLENLMIGAQYNIEFYYMPRTDVQGDNGVSAKWFEGGLDNYMNAPFEEIVADSNTVGWASSAGVDQNGWKLYQGTFVATGETMSLTFEGMGVINGQGGFIDSASVTKVPVPATAILFLTLLPLVSRFKK